jgi:prevent-host-death family protein
MRAEDVMPLTEHRAHMTSNFQHVQETGRPLFVTSNGRTAAVVLSPGAYDELASKAELADHLLLIDRGIEEVKAGRVRDARDGIRELAKKHGIRLDR